MVKSEQKDDSYPRPERVEWWRLHYITQKDTQFKIYELFISKIFYLMFLNVSGLWGN